MTWESLWSRLNLILIGNTSDDTISLETELIEEVYEFLAVSSSLLQDLIGLKEDFTRLSDFSKFLELSWTPIFIHRCVIISLRKVCD